MCNLNVRHICSFKNKLTLKFSTDSQCQKRKILNHNPTKCRLSILSDCFLSSRARQLTTSSSEDFLTSTLVSTAYEIGQCEAQVPLFPSVVHSQVWVAWRGWGVGAFLHLHNLLLNYVLKFLLKLVWWHLSVPPLLKSDERWESLCFSFFFGVPLEAKYCHILYTALVWVFKLPGATYCVHTNILLILKEGGVCVTVYTLVSRVS